MKFNTFYKIYLNEVSPRDSDLIKTYYHGTSSLSSILGILNDNIIKPSESKSKRSLTPAIGHCYMTPSLYYAAIYAIGGIFMGSTSYKPRADDEWGAIFKVDGKQLQDIQPDEDSIGEILYDVINFKEKNKTPIHTAYDYSFFN